LAGGRLQHQQWRHDLERTGLLGKLAQREYMRLAVDGQYPVARIVGQAHEIRKNQELAVLTVHLDPVHAIGAQHADPVPQPVVDIRAFARRAGQPVAQVEHVALAAALLDVAAVVVLKAQVVATARAVRNAGNAAGRRIDRVRQVAHRAASCKPARHQVVQCVVAVPGVAPQLGAVHMHQPVQVVVLHAAVGNALLPVRDRDHVAVLVTMPILLVCDFRGTNYLSQRPSPHFNGRN
jgi:hypothetical protein